MKEKWPIPKATVWIGVAAGLAVIVILVVLIVSQDEEPTGAERPTVALQSTIEPTSQPTEFAEPADAAQESVAENVSEAEPVSTEEPPRTVPDMEEYVSVTESFSVVVPTGWSTEESFPGGAFVMANSEAALERFSDDGTVAAGDIVLNVGFLPFELFRQREVVPLNIQFEATPDVFMQSLLPLFRTQDDAILGDVELVSLSEDRAAGLMTVSDGEHAGLIIMFIAGDEVVGVVSAVGLPGEIDSFQETIFKAATGVVFHGNQGALYGALLEG